MSDSPYELVLDKLDEVGSRYERRGPDQVQALCPAHDETNPSLSIRAAVTDDGKESVLLHCFVGCSIDEVLAALGLGKRDLFAGNGASAKPASIKSGRTYSPRGSKAKADTSMAKNGLPVRSQSVQSVQSPDTGPTGPTGGFGGLTGGFGHSPAGDGKPMEVHLVCTYTYQDEAGNVLYSKLRYSDKSFRFQSPGGSYTLNGTRRVLYNLPAVNAAIAAGQTIYVAEGEKDCDALAGIGLAATCNDSGASKPGDSKWKPECTQTLRDADVIVIADRDKAGYTHARRVHDELVGVARSVVVVEAREGKDAFDHLAAGYSVDDFVPVEFDPDDTEPGHETKAPANFSRELRLTRASAMKPLRVHWAWEGRLALGALSLLAGPEGLGKSTLIAWLVAQVTKGTLEGEHFSQPKAVVIAATEDSWEHTIIPRLMAAGADLNRVFRVDAVSAEGDLLALCLPGDLKRLGDITAEHDVSMLVLDPLTSRLDGKLDTHKDSETRQALEPLVRFAETAGISVVGIMHFNKSGSTDPLALIMASKAFTAVARSVSTVIKDPDDETHNGRLFGTPKNNLGRGDLPVLKFTVEGQPIETDGDGTAWTGRLDWHGEADITIADALKQAASDGDSHATSDAAEWLKQYMHTQGGKSDQGDIAKAAHKAGHSESAIKRAKGKLNMTYRKAGFPAVATWYMPGHEPDEPELDEPETPQSVQSVQSVQSGNADLTGPTDTAVTAGICATPNCPNVVADGPGPFAGYPSHCYDCGEAEAAS